MINQDETRSIKSASKKKIYTKKVLENDLEMEFEFAPITEGLGFHSNARKEDRRTYIPPMPKILDEKKEFGAPQAQLRDSALRAFYEEKKKPSILTLEQESSSKKNRSVEGASFVLQAGAWLIDLTILCASLCLSLLMFIYAARLTPMEFVGIIHLSDILLYAPILFSLYYVLFFSILDLKKTPGKVLSGIKLVSIDSNEAPSFNQTFVRSLVTLLSIPLFFFPLILDFQGKMSDTKIIKD